MVEAIDRVLSRAENLQLAQQMEKRFLFKQWKEGFSYVENLQVCISQQLVKSFLVEAIGRVFSRAENLQCTINEKKLFS